VQHVACAAGFVAGVHFPLGCEPLAQPAKFRYIIGEALNPDGCRGALGEHCDHDRVFVDIEADKR